MYSEGGQVQTHIRMAVHAKAFYLVNNFDVFFIASLLCIGDLPTHIFEKVVRETKFWVCHDVWYVYDVCDVLLVCCIV